MSMIKTARFVLAFLVVAVASSTPAMAGKIHKWVDENGNVHFGDAPPARVVTEQVGTASEVPEADRPAPGEKEFLDAIDKGDIELVKELLNDGARVTQTALYASVKKDKPEMIELLLNARETAISGNLPSPAAMERSMQIYHDQLMAHAVAHNSPKAVSFLARRGANINGTDSRQPLLIKATQRGYPRVVAALLDNGADANLGKGRALRIAAERGDAKTVQALLRAGARVNATGSGHPAGPPLADATRRGHTDVVDMLRAYGAQ